VLVLIQFPFADLRPFVDGASDITIGPLWSLVPDGRNPDFVRGFGALRPRPRANEGPAIRAWPGEAWFARASGAIRFPPLSDASFPSAGVKLVPQLALRRVFSDGCALWRVETGLAFDPRTEPDFRQILATLIDFLALGLRVKKRGATKEAARWSEPTALARLAEPIGRALFDATTFKGTPDACRALKLRPGRPMILVETRATEGAAMWQPIVDGAVRTHSLTMPGDGGSSLEIDFGTMAIDGVDAPFVLLRAAALDAGQTTRDVRTHLCRLHAEREVLTQVLKAAERGRIASASRPLERYLARSQKDLFAESRFGVEQGGLRQIFDVYDGITASETQALQTKLEGLNQTKKRAEGLAGSYRDADQRPHFSLDSGVITVNYNTTNNTTTIQGNVSGIVNVDSTFTNTGTIIQGMDDGHLKSALTALKEVGERLATQMPDDGKKQAVANKVEALTKEATSKEPDHDMLHVTGKGLIEAAKTVAEMAAPIAKAVGVVLSIFGVLL